MSNHYQYISNMLPDMFLPLGYLQSNFSDTYTNWHWTQWTQQKFRSWMSLRTHTLPVVWQCTPTKGERVCSLGVVTQTNMHTETILVTGIRKKKKEKISFKVVLKVKRRVSCDIFPQTHTYVCIDNVGIYFKLTPVWS